MVLRAFALRRRASDSLDNVGRAPSASKHTIAPPLRYEFAIDIVWARRLK